MAGVTPAVMRYAWSTGQEYARRMGAACPGFVFDFGESHPVYDLFKERLPEKPQSYAWYLRVSDIPAFLKHIAPALEKRLAASGACGYTGRQRVSFYRSGLELGFAAGRLVSVEAWQPGARELEGDIAFPDLTFLQLVFGYRSLEELKASFADCLWNTNETRALFEALFPSAPSQVIGLS